MENGDDEKKNDGHAGWWMEKHHPENVLPKELGQASEPAGSCQGIV